MTNETHIQVVFKPQEFAEIKRLSQAQGVSMSTWVRGQVIGKRAPMVWGWWAPYHDRDTVKESRKVQRNAVASRVGTAQHPDFVLERIEQFPDGNSEFRLYEYSGLPYIYPAFQSTNFHTEGFDRGRIMLYGSHRMYKVINSIADVHANNQLRWLLAVDAEAPEKT